MITVRDVLNRPPFQDAIVAAGGAGLDRLVHWVHVGEIPNLGEFLQGHELVLATGIGLTGANARSHFMTGLIDSQAAGLVVELGQYWDTVPEDIVARAEAAAFPVIAFNHPVRFLDLSREIDALVISQHHQVLDDLESLSLHIRQALLNTEGSKRLVEILHQTINHPVWYQPRDLPDSPVILGDWHVEPAVPPEPALNPTQANHYVRQTVMVFGSPVADLYVAQPDTAFDEWLYLAIDRTAAALAQDIIRVESLDRTRRREEMALLSQLLFEADPEPTLCQRFRSRYRFSAQHAFRVVVAEPKTPGFKLKPPSGVTIAEFPETDRTIFVAIGPLTLIAGFAPSSARDFGSGLGLSGTHDDPSALHRALMEAVDAAVVAHLLHERLVDYDTMGMWRWILFTPPQHLRRLVMEPELQPVLARPDAPRLMETLEAVLAHMDSKQAASQALGVHRQTLYARLKVLRQILGDDFLDPPRRLALETALLVYRYLARKPDAAFEPGRPS